MQASTIIPRSTALVSAGLWYLLNASFSLSGTKLPLESIYRGRNILKFIFVSTVVVARANPNLNVETREREIHSTTTTTTPNYKKN
jgi:hypothetical protein